MTPNLSPRTGAAWLARRRWARLATAVCAWSVGLAASAADWVPNETLVSSQADLLDPEYSQALGMFTWSDYDGKLWLGWVNRDTGDFTPSDGKGILVDPDAATYKDKNKTFNGPEWVLTSDGDQIVYTKYAGPHSDNNSRIGLGQQGADGTWTGGFLGPEGAIRKAPYGSMNENDPAPRITYVDNNENHYWRELWDPSTEQPISDFPASNYPVRNVRGARAVVYPLTVDGVDQAFYRDLDKGTVKQLTFDPGNKYEIWMWKAPEFGNELVFMTLVDQFALRVYRYLPTGPDGAKVWTPIYSQPVPKGNKIFSPEPFVWNGKSFIFMAVQLPRNNFKSEIWISNIDASAPIFRRITDNSVLRTRTDPEVFITNRGPLIYYNRFLPKGTASKPKACIQIECSEGIYRADPGLGS